MTAHEKFDSFLSYAAGGSALILSRLISYLPVATEILQFCMALIGVIIISMRLEHDLEVRKKRKAE